MAKFPLDQTPKKAIRPVGAPHWVVHNEVESELRFAFHFPGKVEIRRIPGVYCLASIAELCAQTNTFVIELARAIVPGQRDLILRPIS